MNEGDLICHVPWHVNPFRGDKFEEAWLPHAAAVLRFGATEWSFLRGLDDPLEFKQYATFPDKTAWERYWYSEEIAEARAATSGMYQVPILPIFWRVKGAGELATEPVG
jgi:hypothetical protein